NWKTESNGIVEEVKQTSDQNLIFISSYKGEKKNNKFYINSISLNTGITNWIKETSLIKVIQATEKDNALILSDGLQKISGLDLKTGANLWENTLDEKLLLANNSSNQTLLLLTYKNLYGINTSNGRILTKNELPYPNSYVPNYLVELDSSIFIGGSDGKVIKLSKIFRKPIWKYKTGGSISSLIITNNRLLVSSFDNFVYLLNIRNGKLMWKKRMEDRVDIKPIIYNNSAFISSTSGIKVSIIDLSEGKLINQIQLEEGSYSTGSPLILESGILLPTNKGLYLYSTKCS
ncbi:MAG TPA: PQQ-binding-like beta-propeller repeat protein, partial [Allocoleopsis sp.]